MSIHTYWHSLASDTSDTSGHIGTHTDKLSQTILLRIRHKVYLPSSMEEHSFLDSYTYDLDSSSKTCIREGHISNLWQDLFYSNHQGLISDELRGTCELSRLGWSAEAYSRDINYPSYKTENRIQDIKHDIVKGQTERWMSPTEVAKFTQAAEM